MTTASRKTETTNAIIEIELTREVKDKVAYLDGYNVSAGREVYERYEVKLTHKRSGNTIRTNGRPGDFAFFARPDRFSGKFPAGAYARVGDAYITQEIYDAAMGIIAELDAEVSKTEEQIALEQAEAERKRIGEENLARMEAEYKERSNHPGWCDKCHSYCYGDCEANS
jgi:hypothetical protein